MRARFNSKRESVCEAEIDIENGSGRVRNPSCQTLLLSGVRHRVSTQPPTLVHLKCKVEAGKERRVLSSTRLLTFGASLTTS
jgi:hypothetical protein